MTGSRGTSNRNLLRILVFIAVPVVFIAVLAVVWAKIGRSNKGKADTVTFEVRRGNLLISVTESGNVEANETVDVLCEVEGGTRVTSVVPEGTVLTEEDVRAGTVIMELDSSQLTEQKNQEDIQLENAKAALTDAEESKNIQEKQNESDISAGQLKVKFGLMELQKYMGQAVADSFVASADPSKGDPLDFGLVWSDPNQPAIGGEALQTWRDLQSAIELADEQLKRAKDKYDWTEKLYAKTYVARTELEADRLAQRQREIDVEQARTAMSLFKRYEFPMQVEQKWSDYIEAQRELDRIEAKARSMITQANAKLSNAQSQYNLQKQQNDKLARQIQACTIKAPTTGLVVYGSSGEYFRRRSEPIEVGTQVYERQKLLKIPNTSAMKVETKVHETSVDKVYPGLPALITVEAFPDKVYTGEVTKVSPLPDAQRGWLNPDLKVYNTDVSIKELELSLRPGMSAKVEIIIEQFEDVLYVPVQSIVNRAGKKYCYVQASNKLEEREVRAGSFNENFIVIHDGLKEGDKVTLKPPRGTGGVDPRPKSIPSGAGQSSGSGSAKSVEGRSGDGTGEGGQERIRSRGRGRGERRSERGESDPRGGSSANGPGDRQRSGGMDAEMMKKLQSPEVQAILQEARKQGGLTNEQKESLQALGIPEETIQAMERRGGRGGAGDGGRGGGRGERGGRRVPGSGGGAGREPE